MTAVDHEHAPVGRTPSDSSLITVAAIASLAAGAIHAAAIGVHSEHRAAVIAFTLVAAFQLGWGALALRHPGRVLALAGVIGHVAAFGGWVTAKTSGIGFVAGIDQAEAVQFADAAAAGLAVVAVAATLVGVLRLVDSGSGSWAHPRLASGAAVLAVALTVPAMVSAGEHRHQSDHGHDEEVAHAAADEAGHVHDDSHDHDGDEGHGEAGHDDVHAASPVPPKPYHPDLPIDLSGVEGVTPEQQARAENLVAVTLLRLPRFADFREAEAAGYRSIGDGFTGHEHFINPELLEDGRILDPDFPESLVYSTEGGQRTLVAAMYMLERGATLDDVPDLGGALTQWHVHDDLCFNTEGRVAGLVEPGADCQPPLVNGVRSPMIHVWIIPHECGPFASLEGVAGGQIAEGEERLCDHAHGAA
jgi:hypothetical protein